MGNTLVGVIIDWGRLKDEPYISGGSYGVERQDV